MAGPPALPVGLEKALGHDFVRRDLLVEALTHPGAADRRRSGRGYDRLEFLGDRVLSLVIAELLWRRYPADAEGPLTRRHTHLVRREALTEVAKAVGLGAALIVAPGEETTGLRRNDSVLADVCEAVIAALYLDGGLGAAAAFVEHWWQERLDTAGTVRRDPKTALQEWAQGRGLPLPAYDLVGTEGPDHRRVFTVRVTVEGLPEMTATGTSKRAAEAAAAAAVLSAIVPS